MLKRIEAISAQGALLNLSLEDLDRGFLLENVEGLDPVKATITSSSFAQLDGSQYQSSRREERNIKLTISLEPDYSVNQSVRDLRRRLYNYFMSKAPVDLRFYDSDGSVAYISGRVESFETNLFSAEPAVDISIICFDPDFYDPTPVRTTGNTVSNMDAIQISYDGSVETGVVFSLSVNRAMTDFTIYHVDPSGALRQLDFAGTLQAGDVLTISTVQGDKYVRLFRAGVLTSFLYGVSPQSAWLELQPGDNFIRVYATGAGVPFTIDHIQKYGGL